MRVTIWDLDWYYAENKTNKQNPDVMRISSYHKQLGDIVNFVTKEDDIRRPYDVYYIIKEDSKTPNPPLDFFMNNKVKWWGNAFKVKVKWKMNAAMLGVRPDYLLYPEKDTTVERAEHVRFFDNTGEMLPMIQTWKNTFSNKMVVVDDNSMWYASKNNIIKALKILQESKNIYFLKPISLKILLSDEEIKNEFLKLKFRPGCKFVWNLIHITSAAEAFNFIDSLRLQNKNVDFGTLLIDYRDKTKSHWEDKQNAINDFNNVVDLILTAKKRKIKIEVKMPDFRLETPYFQIFEELSYWTQHHLKKSWLEYITIAHPWETNVAAFNYWNRPEKWNPVFRILLVQTYKNKELITLQWGNKSLNIKEIPWAVWKEQFKNEQWEI